MWLLKEEKTDYLRVDPAETILEVSELELKRMGNSSSRAFFRDEFGTEAFLLSADHEMRDLISRSLLILWHFAAASITRKSIRSLWCNVKILKVCASAERCPWALM